MRKNTVATLDIEFDAQALEKAHRRAVVELCKCLRKEIGIRSHLLGKLLGRTHIGQVAAPLTRDTNLAARLLHLFEQQHVATS